MPLRLDGNMVSAAKRPSVRPRLEGEMPKTVSFGRNVQEAKSSRVWSESSRGRNVRMCGSNHPGAKRSGANHPGAKHLGGKTS